MVRPLPIEYPGAYYHVMNRGLSHRDIFLEDKGRESFLDLLSIWTGCRRNRASHGARVRQAGGGFKAAAQRNRERSSHNGDIFESATERAPAQRDRQSVGFRQRVVSKLGVSAEEVKGSERPEDRPKGAKDCGCADKKLKADLTPFFSGISSGSTDSRARSGLNFRLPLHPKLPKFEQSALSSM